jgi:A/G-specific adenine glycosylase
MTENSMKKGQQFAHHLLQWNETSNRRDMPWKGEKDPYRIWLSEIILQQTRVEQGLKYYERFVQALPTMNALAAAPEEQVFKLWEGLGYYSRCRNLMATAKTIVEKWNGHFPTRYEDILSLKGIGPYTAAAIASFAYNAPYAVLDGNVFRVLSRIWDEAAPVDTTGGKKLFTRLAQAMLPAGKAGMYNQSIMDFGATLCKPVPECNRCFFREQCAAFLMGTQLLRPVKTKTIAVKSRWFHYILLEHTGDVAITRRSAGDIWQGLNDVLLVEGGAPLEKVDLVAELEARGVLRHNYDIVSYGATATQRLTHQLIHFRFLHIELKERVYLHELQWISKNNLRDLAFPKTLQHFLARNVTL